MSATRFLPNEFPANARVLLVGDNQQLISAVQDHLDRATSITYSVTHAPRIGAIDDLMDAKEPELLLLDLDPRESRGIELLRQAKAKLGPIPIVAMSSIEDEEFASEVLQSGADGYLAKSELSSRTLSTAIGVALGIQSTIEMLTSARDRERHLATHDGLTGLPNRGLALDQLREAVEIAQRHDQKLAMLIVDLDGFRSINDSLGHAVGDGLLRGISRRLSSCLSENDTVARLGGDEFAIIQTELRDEADATRMAEAILRILDKPVPFIRRPTTTTASIGISLFPKDARGAEELIELADTALHHAKGRGRNRFEFYSKSMKSAALHRLAVEGALKAAIERESFFLHYQPQFDLRLGKITGAEALIRWNHPDLGKILPIRFLSVAEETGLIVPIGEWVLREACRQHSEWIKQGHRGLRISVNVAAQQIQHPTFADTVRSVLRDYKLQPTFLELEITESALVSDVEATTSTLCELRDMGVRLAIDDFGTGYSSLAYLKRLPVHVLKIDQSFVKNLASDPYDATIIQTIINMSRGLELSTIAEGVEEFHQLLMLGSYGCHRMQGNLFGKPVSADEFLPWITNPPFSWTKSECQKTLGEFADHDP